MHFFADFAEIKKSNVIQIKKYLAQNWGKKRYFYAHLLQPIWNLNRVLTWFKVIPRISFFYGVIWRILNSAVYFLTETKKLQLAMRASHLSKIKIDQNHKICLQILDIWCKNIRSKCSDSKIFFVQCHPSFFGGVKFKFDDHEIAQLEVKVGALETPKHPRNKSFI